MEKQISLADLIAGIGGAVALLFSFFSFIGFSGFSIGSAWGSGLFPLATFPALFGLIVVVIVVLQLTGTKLPDQILTLSIDQIKLFLSVYAALTMIGWLILDSDGAGLQIGGIFMLLGSLAMTAGTVMTAVGAGTNMISLGGGQSSSNGAPPPPPGDDAPPPPPPSDNPPPPPPAN